MGACRCSHNELSRPRPAFKFRSGSSLPTAIAKHYTLCSIPWTKARRAMAWNAEAGRLCIGVWHSPLARPQWIRYLAVAVGISAVGSPYGVFRPFLRASSGSSSIWEPYGRYGVVHDRSLLGIYVREERCVTARRRGYATFNLVGKG